MSNGGFSMLLTIIKKEILANLLSFRFAVSLLLCMILIPMSAYVLKDDYKQELSDYNGRVMAYEEHLRTVKSINNVSPMYDRAPAVLSVMFKRGAANRIIEIVGSSRAHFRTDTSDPISTLLPVFDMGAIMGVILSLMAILFGYDALVSEKEGGTLKLILSNSVSRSQVLLGKWIGGYVTLLLPLAISAIVSLLIVLIDPVVDLHGSDWLALGLILLGAMIYISIFFAFAYLISAISRSFAASALTSLCVWLFIVLIVPNVSIYAADKLRSMPSIQEVHRKEREMQRERDRKAEKLITEFMSKGPTKEEEAEFFQEALADDGFLVVDIRNQIAEERKLEDSFERKANMQINLARQISAISPYACFAYLANTLSGTGVEAEQSLAQKTGRYFAEWIDYILEKHQRNTRSIIDINKKTDVSDMPRFRYVELSVSERLSASLSYFLLLVMFNVVFFMAAYVTFLRSGVR
jgi:ABC-type transport system involved in multi-copper enzyme maturation permease subunit